jgi:hypothetical protein
MHRGRVLDYDQEASNNGQSQAMLNMNAKNTAREESDHCLTVHQYGHGASIRM